MHINTFIFLAMFPIPPSSPLPTLNLTWYSPGRRRKEKKRERKFLKYLIRIFLYNKNLPPLSIKISVE
jgi:hypothetical protein